MRVGDAQVLVRIYRHVVDAYFVVEVGAGAAAAVADVPDGVAAMEVLSGVDCEAFHVAVARGDSVAMVNDDGPSVSTHEIGELDCAVSRSYDRLPVKGANVHARVKGAFPVEGIDA